jgi:thioredoxin-dependent peroxiredoxin
MAIELGSLGPPVTGKAFWLGRSEGENFDFDLKTFAGKAVVLAFYPADFTPVCTSEMCDFADNVGALADLHAQVVGISIDSIDRHADFARRYSLKFPLIADTDKVIGQAYGVAGNFVRPGHKRALFVIDAEGRLVWKKIELAAVFRTDAKTVKKVLAGLK